MHYNNIHRGVFLARPNRFIAHVRLDGACEAADFVICHVKNTGRCRELLVPGAVVYLQESDNPARKTKYDLIAVEKGTGESPPTAPTRLINMDAQAPNKVFQEWAEAGRFLPGLTLLRPETTWGNSRFDFYFEQSIGAAGEPPCPAGAAAPVCNDGGRTADERTALPVGGGLCAAPAPARIHTKGFVEVKGVTLEEGGAVFFPDAPTERGVKHIEELMACRAAGYEAYLCFVIQMTGADYFSPNDRTHPAFGGALRRAAAAGVHILACDCTVTPDSLSLRAPVEIRL